MGRSPLALGSEGIVHTPKAALQAARWTATARDPHQRLAQPCAAAQRNVAGARCARNATRRCARRCESSFQRPPISGSRYTQAVQASTGELRVAGKLAATSRGKCDPVALRRSSYWAAIASDWRYEGGIAAEGLASRGCSVDDEVQPTSVVGGNAGGCGVRQPLLQHNATLRSNRLSDDLETLQRLMSSYAGKKLTLQPQPHEFADELETLFAGDPPAPVRPDMLDEMPSSRQFSQSWPNRQKPLQPQISGQ